MTKSDSSSYTEFGKRLKSHRLQASITTQRELTERLGDLGVYYDYTVVSHWEKGRRCPPLETLIAIIQVFVELGSIKDVATANELLRLADMRNLNEDEVARIFGHLDQPNNLLNAGFEDLVKVFTHAPYGIRPDIRDFTHYIEEKTQGFVGRQWVFDGINEFLKTNSRGYYFIIGDPGIGKTSIAAQMVKQHGHIHHFNIRAEGINTTAKFLRNVCAQLVAAYGLEHAVLPREASDDAGFLRKLLNKVSEKLGPSEKCVIVVDALDEADTSSTLVSSNLLCLPLTVPRGVFFLVTMREDDERRIRPRVDCEQDILEIDHDSSDNLSDIADFLQASTARSSIQAYLTANDFEAREFIAIMVNKSEGNFMYLYHVLPEIERGAYKDRKLETIPQGLQNYYEDHWRRMRGADEVAWFEYKLPVLVALTAVLEPVSIDLLAAFSKIQSRARIRSVLQDWAPFVHDEPVEHEGVTQRLYRLYHASFFEFIAAKQEVEDERVDLKAAHTQIADTLWADLGLDETLL